MKVRHFIRLLSVLTIVAALTGCGKATSTLAPEINNPGGGDDPPPAGGYTKIERLGTSLAANNITSAAAEGAKVFGTGTFFSLSNPDTPVEIGTITDGVLNVNYNRTVQGGETFSICLWAQYGDEYHRLLNGIKINGVELTAVASSRWGLFRLFQVSRNDGVVTINTMRNDNPKLVTVKLVYTGVDPDLPADSDLNNPASVDNVAKFSSTWSATNREHFAPWDDATQSRTEQIIAVMGDTTMARFNVYDPRVQYVKEMRAGCYAIGSDGQQVELINLYDLDPRPDNAWMYFELVVDSNGHVVNPRPSSDERYFDIGIGLRAGDATARR